MMTKHDALTARISDLTRQLRFERVAWRRQVIRKDLAAAQARLDNLLKLREQYRASRREALSYGMTAESFRAEVDHIVSQLMAPPHAVTDRPAAYADAAMIVVAGVKPYDWAEEAQDWCEYQAAGGRWA